MWGFLVGLMLSLFSFPLVFSACRAELISKSVLAQKLEGLLARTRMAGSKHGRGGRGQFGRRDKRFRPGQSGGQLHQPQQMPTFNVPVIPAPGLGTTFPQLRGRGGRGDGGRGRGGQRGGYRGGGRGGRR